MTESSTRFLAGFLFLVLKVTFFFPSEASPCSGSYLQSLYSHLILLKAKDFVLPTRLSSSFVLLSLL